MPYTNPINTEPPVGIDFLYNLNNKINLFRLTNNLAQFG